MDITVHRGSGKLQHIIDIGAHRLLTDTSVANGGEDSGPEPHDLLAAALGACTALTVTLYARHKQWDLRDIEVRVAHGQKDGVYELRRYIRYIGELDAEQRERLTGIANKCPVHKTLSGQFRIETEAE